MRSRQKSAKERRDEEVAIREAALATSLDSSNKGFKMLSKLGYKPGTALGKSGTEGASEPIRLALKDGRGGIGLDSDRKRKIREEMEHAAKKVKADEVDYRDRVRIEREEKRLDGQIHGAQKIAEKFDCEADDTEEAGTVETARGSTSDTPAHKMRPLNSINVLWRGLARHRLEKERDRRMRYDLQQSLSRLPTYEDSEEDATDKQALGTVVEELEEEDLELEGFNAIAPDEKLSKLVIYLRDTYNYCFWCKYQYPDAKMDGCPGLTEEDHD